VSQQSQPVKVHVGEIVKHGDGAQVIAVRAADMDWSLTRLPDDDAPRIRDIDLAERLGFEQPRMIRKTIARHVAAGNISPSCRSTVERQPVGPKGKSSGEREYTVNEYWLTEEEALFVATQSETKRAVFITKVMIAVFVAVRRKSIAIDAAPVADYPQIVVQNSTTSLLGPQYRLVVDAPLSRLAHRLKSKFGGKVQAHKRGLENKLRKALGFWASFAFYPVEALRMSALMVALRDLDIGVSDRTRGLPDREQVETLFSTRRGLADSLSA
jgi:hypothetical protein